MHITVSSIQYYDYLPLLYLPLWNIPGNDVSWWRPQQPQQFTRHMNSNNDVKVHASDTPVEHLLYELYTQQKAVQEPFFSFASVYLRVICY